MELSVVIVNYKTPELLDTCIRSIKSSAPDVDDIIVVDSDSQDESVDMVRKNHPDVKIIASTTNGGFGTGANWGMHYGKYDTFLLLNADIEVLPGAIEKLYDTLHSDPALGLVAPKLLNTDGSLQLSCHEFYRFMTPIYRRTPLGNSKRGQRELRRFTMADWDHNQTRDVAWVIGAAMMMRKEALEKVGYMDQRFFLYFEDVDLCRRLWEGGYRVRYVADAIFRHKHKRDSAMHSGFKSLFYYMTRVHVRSWVKYYRKYHGQLEVPAFSQNAKRDG